MKILVFGNVGSGKSYLINELSALLPDFEVLAIDDFRRKIGDGSMEKEIEAKEAFIAAIQPDKNQIIEAMGFGETGFLIASELKYSDEKKLIILLTTPLDICLKRIKNRVWNVPYPAPPKKAKGLAKYTQKMIENKELYLIWLNAKNVKFLEFPIMTKQNIHNIYREVLPVTRLKQYTVIDKLPGLLASCENIAGAALIGSFGRNAPTYNSDIDVLLLVEQNFEPHTFIESMRTWFPDTFTIRYFEIRNKIVVFFNNMPKLELIINHQITELERLFVGSEIYSTSGIILKDHDKQIADFLNKCILKTVGKPFDFEKSFRETTNKFLYDFESCSYWHSRSNAYKAYFNYNLALNDCFQLQKIQNRNVSQLYLPDVTDVYEGKEATDRFKQLNGTLYLPELNEKKRLLLNEFYAILEKAAFHNENEISEMKYFCETIYKRDFGYNFRDIAANCNKIKPNIIFRTSTLTRFQHTEHFDVYKTEFGIKTIIDLRANREIEKDPYSKACKQHFNIVWAPFDPWNQSEEFKANYNYGSHSEIAYRFFALECQNSFKTIVETIINPANHPIAMHCHAGKDRTGTVVALLYLLGGATMHEVYTDYFASEADTKEYKLNAFLEFVNKYESVESYLISCGLTNEQIEALKFILMQNQTIEKQ